MDFKCVSNWGILFLFLAFSVTEQAGNSGSIQRPNVLFIVVDDLRPTLGCYGEPLLRTPNIDNLASKSILFEQAFVQQAVCGPSRISFLTSRRPDTTRLYDFHSYWRVHAGNYTTLPQYFKENGYITQSVGKVFHPGIASNKSDDSPYSWTNTPFHPPTQDYKNAKVCPNKDGSLGSNIVCPVDVSQMPGQSLPDLQSADFAVEFLKNTSETLLGKPFFLAVGFHKPHIPLKYPKKYKSLYPLTDIKLAKYHTYPWGMPLVAFNPGVGLRDRDDVKRLNLSFPFGPFPDYFQILMRQSYYAATSYMDAQVGRVLEALERNGFAENTIVSFIGDHGWALGEHQTWSKYSLFEVANKVPFLLYVPGLTYHKTSSRERLFPFFDLFQMVPNTVSPIKSLSGNLLFVSEETNAQFITTDQGTSRVSAISAHNINRTWTFEPRYKTSAFAELVDLFPTLAEAAGLPSLPLCPPNPYKIWLCTEGSSLMPLVRNIIGLSTDQRRDNPYKNVIGSNESSVTSRTTPGHALLLYLTHQCFPGFILSVANKMKWKTAVFSQYPRPSAYPQHNTELPHLADIRIMGYSMWTVDFHYTEWVSFNSTTYDIGWDEVYGRELYLRSSDPYEIDNVALQERCFPLIVVLSKHLRDGWRQALPS